MVGMKKPRAYIRSLDRRVEGLDLGSTVDASFVGGMRMGGPSGTWRFGLNVTWPLVRLSLFPSGLRMEASNRVHSGGIPVWEARYDELSEIQAVGRIPLFSTGIRFRIAATNEWVIFWSPDRPAVLQAIGAHGLVANHRPIRFRNLDPGRSNAVRDVAAC
jgi:hypothetical protein